MADPLAPPEDERELDANVHIWPQAEEPGPQATGTIYKVSIGLQVDNALPRDSMFVTPHVEDMNGASAPSALATQIATNMVSYHGSRCSPQTSADTDRLAMPACNGAPEGGRVSRRRY